jgi:putative Holliday junction resolvase
MAADIPIEDLSARLPTGARLAGLDLGEKTIGIALSDPGLRIATPFHTIRRTKFSKDAKELLAICARENIGGLVLGLPINMNGTEGPRAQATRAFLRNLAALTDLPVALWDERLSTAAAERAMLEADLSRRKRAERIDAAAASFILQGALDRLAALAAQRRAENGASTPPC